MAIVRHIHKTIGNTGTKPDSIEQAQSEAWLAVGAIRQILENGERCPDDLSDKAIELAKRWRALLI